MYNETYDDYIRSILGYSPMSSYEDNYGDYRNQNINYNMTSNMNTNNMNSTSVTELESCYPEIYKIVYPMVSKKCDSVIMPVTNDDIQNMTDEIYFALEERNDIQVNINLTNEVRGTGKSSSTIDKKQDVKISEISDEKRETRQINRGLRDLIQILLIRELLRRFRRPGMPGRPPMPRPPMPRPRPPMRPPFRPGFGTGNTMFNRDFEISNYDIFEN